MIPRTDTHVPATAGHGDTIFDSPLFDSFDGWASVLRRSPPTVAPEAGIAVAAAVQPPAEAPPWVPRRRPPMALLHAVDDGRDTGETLRVRGDTLVVGRRTGSIDIPHDPHLEAAHARLDRLPGEGWLLTDLGSADGTWVRVTTARLREGTSVRLGSATLTFLPAESPSAILVVTPRGTRRVVSPEMPFLVGREGAGPAVVPHANWLEIDDPHVSPVHAEVISRRGRARIVNHGLNGLWVRIAAPVRLGSTAQFRCGDQRFVLEGLS